MNFRNTFNSRALSSHNYNIEILGNPLTNLERVNFLGVTIDQTFSWNSQVDNLYKKISSNIFVLKQISRLGDNKLTKAVHHGLIMSRIRYSILLWGNSAKYNMDSVFKMQTRAIRTMTGIRQNHANNS